MLSYGEVWFASSGDLRESIEELVRLRLADRTRSVTREMRDEMLLSMLLRPRWWLDLGVGGAGGERIGTVASLTGIATGTGGADMVSGGGGGGGGGIWSSLSITISIIPAVRPP